MTNFDEEIDLTAVMAEFETFKTEQAQKEAMLLEIRNELIEAQRVVNKLNAQREELANDLNLGRHRVRELERKAESARKLKEAQAKRDELLKEYEARSIELDKLTQDNAWRVGVKVNDTDTHKAYPHQIEGGKRLAIAERGILGDKRGLGKTLTSIIYLDMVQARKVLIIAPNDVVDQFEGEIQMWANSRRIMSFAGLNPDQRKIIYPMLKMLDSFVITLNYEAWRRDKKIIDDLISAGIDTIILDEAHRAKASNKQTAKGIFQVAFAKNYCPSCETIVPVDPWLNPVTKKFNQVDPLRVYSCDACGSRLEATVTNVVSMTGTPILNKPQELFTMLHLRDPFRFTDEAEFLRTYCYSYAPGKWRFMTGGLERLTKSMSEFFVQRTREDAGIIIPPPAIKIHELEPDPVAYPLQYKAYKDLTDAAALILEDGTAVSMLYVLEIILRERQIMTWPAGVELKIRDEDGEVVNTLKFDVEESQKLDAVCELLTELSEEGERWIAFSKFKAPLYEARNRMVAQGFSVTTATGDDAKSHRDRVRFDFDLKTADKDNPQWAGCFATFDAFATGINLNAARHVIMIDDEWSPGMEDQAIGRIDRLNSTDQANVHIFRVNKTIDTFMASLIEQKRELTEGFEGGFRDDLLNFLKTGAGFRG